jgi:DNA/RNA endonuclease YhcR with UshA esterase domain
MDANVLPYRENLRLVVVHVHAKSPRPVTFQLDSKAHDTYELRVRQVDAGKAANAVIDEDTGTVLVKADLMGGTGDLYEFLPDVEMDDMRAFVLPVGATVAITGEVTQHKGKPDEDSNSVSSVVHVVDR